MFHNYYTAYHNVEIRIGPNPAPLTIPFILLPGFEYYFNWSTQFNSNLLNFLLRCYSYCLLHPWTSLIPWLAPFQYFPNVCSIIYTFNMIVSAFEFFYLLSCGLVIACHTKLNQTCGKSDIACFSCRLSTFRAGTGLYKPVQAPTRKFWEYWCWHSLQFT
jgi:hypothetical protein